MAILVTQVARAPGDRLAVPGPPDAPDAVASPTQSADCLPIGSGPDVRLVLITATGDRQLPIGRDIQSHHRVGVGGEGHPDGPGIEGEHAGPAGATGDPSGGDLAISRKEPQAIDLDGLSVVGLPGNRECHLPVGAGKQGNVSGFARHGQHIAGAHPVHRPRVQAADIEGTTGGAVGQIPELHLAISVEGGQQVGAAAGAEANIPDLVLVRLGICPTELPLETLNSCTEPSAQPTAMRVPSGEKSREETTLRAPEMVLISVPCSTLIRKIGILPGWTLLSELPPTASRLPSAETPRRAAIPRRTPRRVTGSCESIRLS